MSRQNPFATDESFAQAAEPDQSDRLSQNGQMIAISVFGSLLLVGFFFGVVTGYAPSSRPAPSAVAVARNDPEPARPAPRPNPKAAVTPTPAAEPKAPAEPEPEPEPEPKPNPKPKPRPKITPDPGPAPEPTPEPKMETRPQPKKSEPPALRPVSFEKDVKPILRTYCFNCHGAAGKPKGDVDVTSHAAIFDPKNPKIVEPGEPQRSALLLTIEDMSMPPQGPRPSKGETDIIRNWILTGAKP